jgi:pimeloyl-ACP methyl ester carboxylesterase
MRFVLIHGGFHGAWCWERVIPELRQLGHQAVAIDLPQHGERGLDPTSSVDERSAAILDVLQPGDVLVGHSGGGYDVTFAADRAPEKVRHVVYLAAGLPLEGRTVLEATGGAAQKDEKGEVRITRLMDDDTGMLRYIRPNAEGRMVWTSKEGAREFFYHDCDAATIDWAFGKLTPSALGFISETIQLKNFWRADLPRSYIQCEQDRAKPHRMSVQVCERLGVAPLKINTSHSPFLSKPAELAKLLVQAVSTKPLGPLRPG